MKKIKIYWKIPLVISIFVALFWTIWYLNVGSVPSLLFFHGNTYYHWIFSRWLDIPTCFISLMLIQTFFIPMWKEIKATHHTYNHKMKYVIPKVISIFGCVIIVLGIISFFIVFWLNLLFGIVCFLSIVLIGIVVMMLAEFIDTICKWFLSTKFYIWLIN